MDSHLLLNKPKPTSGINPTITRINPTITRMNSLVLVSEESKKSSAKLKKIFETRTYQKKTQVTVLDRYKRKLDSINKTNEKRTLRKKQTKLNPPEIKKYVGEFFSPGGDALKTFAGLSALGAFENFKKGDWVKGIGSTLLTVGALGGLGLGGLGMLMNGGGKGAASAKDAPGGKLVSGATANRTVFGGITSRLGKVGSPTGTSGIKPQVGLAARQFEAGAFRQTPGARAAFPVALPGTPSRAEKLGGVAQNIANRFGAGATRGGGGAAQISTRAGGTAAAKAAGVGARAIPLLGAAVNIGLSAYRFNQGDVVGGILSAVSAIPVVGWAALGIDLAREFGAFDGTFLGRKGQDKLKKQTKKQKDQLEKKKESKGGLTFRKTLDRYEKCIDKFEQFVKGFKDGMGMGGEQSGVIETGNRGLDTGEKLQDLEATGGEIPGAPNSRFGPRGGREHKGNDYNRPVGTPISIIQPGVVTVADMNYEPNGWGAVVEIRHQDGSISRYAHLSEITVAAGTQVSPGQVIGKVGGAEGAPGSGNSTGPHLHFEYENGSGRIDPTAAAPKIFRFGGNVKVKQSRPSQRPPLDDPTTGETPRFRQSTAEALRKAGQPSAAAAAEKQQTFQTLGSSIVDETITVDPKDNIISQTTRPLYQPQVINVPYPVITKQSSSNVSSGGGIMISGIDEEQALNTYYKKILLNTIG